MYAFCPQPVIESCTNIGFLPMTYGYEELWQHMHPSTVSPWTNNWIEVYDFTPHKKAATGEPNYYINSEIDPSFIKPLKLAKEVMARASASVGHELKSLD